jgi:ribosomal protein L3 glutamine methyltransferase
MSELTDLQTIRDLIRWTASSFTREKLFFGHGTETAWDEAVALIFHVLHVSHDLYAVVLDARVTHIEKEAISRLVHLRIEKRVPLPYLTHQAWFAGLEFYVDERVLVPRSPFAELILQQFSPWIEGENVRSILDLCTGSACIAIASAKYFADIDIHASDISADALAVAKMNLERHHLLDRITLFQSDVFAGIPPKKYDLIVSNPPYVDAEDMASLPKEYHHEPEHALASGNDGLVITENILNHAAAYLADGGALFVEVGNSEVALQDKFPQVPFTWIEFEHGGGGVFMLTKAQLLAAGF